MKRNLLTRLTWALAFAPLAAVAQENENAGTQTTPTAPAGTTTEPATPASRGASDESTSDVPTAGTPTGVPGTDPSPAPAGAVPVPQSTPLTGSPAVKPNTGDGVSTSAGDTYGEDVGGVEVVVVTGSRIGRANTDSYGNVAVISRDDIQAAGVVTVDDLLTQLPQVSQQGIGRNVANGGNGLAFVDLRNLGPGRTLVLLNGRRMVMSSDGTSEAVDLNNVPVTMVERVEILLDGASAVYGSDAIGGVVNVVFKDNYEGAEVRSTAGISQRGDSEQIGVSGTIGQNFEKGNVTFNIGYVRRGRLDQRDRDWARSPVVDWSKDSDGDYRLTGSAFNPAGSANGYIFEPSNGSSFTRQGLGNRYNYGPDQVLSGSMERFNIAATGRYDLNNHVSAYMEGLFTARKSVQGLSGQPLHSGNATFREPGLFVPIDNPFIPQDFKLGLPAGTDGVTLNRRMLDVGRRVPEQWADTFRLVGGLTGDFGSKDFRWDISANVGRTRQTEQMRNSVNLARVRETLDPTICGSAANPTEAYLRGCRLGDYFGSQLQPEVLDYIRYTDTSFLGFDMFMSEASVTGNIVELPGGMAKFAVGGDFRREAGFNQPSAHVVAGDSANNGQDPTAGSFKVGSLFGELNLPILSRVPGAHELTVDLAARYTRYNRSNFGAELTYRAGLAWAPIEDFKLRSNFSRAFRAPQISQLYGGSADSYEEATDPCDRYLRADVADNVVENCRRQNVPGTYDQNTFGTQIRSNIGGNPNLEAETANVFNLGTVIQPVATEGLTITADYYRLRVFNAITALNVQTILDRCYNSDPNNPDPLCGRIGRSGQGNVNALDARSQNVGSLETEGVDMTIGYDLPVSRLGFDDEGRITLGWQGNYLLNYDENILGEKVDYEGTIAATSGSYAHFRWNAQARYGRENWNVGALVRWIGGAEVFGIRGPSGSIRPDVVNQRLPAVFYADLVGSYSWNNFTFIAGIDNVFDRSPPFLIDGGTNSNPLTYDFVGRYFYTTVAYNF